jgi:hypothetical protein
MFDVTTMNNTTKVNNKVHFSAVSGTLIKSTPNSRIIRFHMDSELAETFFHIENPHYKKSIYKRSTTHPHTSYTSELRIDVVVLQVMLCGNNEYLVEFLENEKGEQYE